MPKSINKSSPKEDHGHDHGHRKEKPRNSRGTVRGEIQVSGRKTGKRGTKGHTHRSGHQRGARHGAEHGTKAHGSDHIVGHRNNRVPAGQPGMDDHHIRDQIIIDRVESTLDRIARQVFANPNSILPFNDGYQAFGRYTIAKQAQYFEVYRGATLAACPSSARLALAWCIADKLGKFTLTQEITLFDQEIERRRDEIRYFRHMIETTTDTERRYVLEDRLQHSHSRLKWLQEHLDKCVNLAKYWQQKGFKDETARIGLKNNGTA